MFFPLGMNRGSSRWRRRLAFAVLFGLQSAIALSPLLDVGKRGGVHAHIEDRGARHAYQHDDATCAVCSVLSMHAAPAQKSPPVAVELRRSVADTEIAFPQGRRPDGTPRARAPPTLG